MSEYEQKAQAFLERHNLEIVCDGPNDSAPPWDDEPSKTKHQFWKPDEWNRASYTVIEIPRGDGWQVTIRHKGSARGLSFPYWSSISDKAKRLGVVSLHESRSWPKRRPYPVKDWKPSAYDILACISSDQYTPADFTEFCAEFGYYTDSRRAEAMHRRCVEFALKLRQFFTEDQLAELGEIQ